MPERPCDMCNRRHECEWTGGYWECCACADRQEKRATARDAVVAAAKAWAGGARSSGYDLNATETALFAEVDALLALEKQA